MFHVEHSDRAARWLVEGAHELGIGLTAEAVSTCLRHLGELKKWNRRVNLTALRDDRDIIVKHFLDSLVCCKAVQVPSDAAMLDIGTGAGFPGIPIKIACSTIQLSLLEPSQKKAAFLRHVVGFLGLKLVTILRARLEELSKVVNPGQRYSHVVSRALDPRDFEGAVRQILEPDGSLILWRSRSGPVLDRVDGLPLSREVPYDLPFGYGSRKLCIFSLT